jgi:hypothetical protein
MTIFNRRNALVGFITLKALERKVRRKRRRNSRKIAAFVGLGLISGGLLAALAVFALRRQREGNEAQRLEGYAVADEDVGDKPERFSPEPAPAA